MLIIGHRGAKGLAPENTLASLQAALDARASIIEFDVRVSQDNVAVLSHDDYIRDTSGKKLNIQTTNFSDLQLAKSDFLTLEAALHFIDRRADVIIEIKPSQPIEPIASAIEPRIMKNWQESDIILSSFDFKILKSLHEKFPSIQVAVNERWSGVRATRRARKLGTKRIMMNQKWLWSGFIRSMARGDYKLSAYTINDVRKARRFAKHGLYGCVTDFPDRFINK